jgi:hypothetical protein
MADMEECFNSLVKLTDKEKKQALKFLKSFYFKDADHEIRELKMENKCILCGKKKENHIKCTTNEKILWCYNNKEYPKKWAYQYTPKRTEDADHEKVKDVNL